MKNEIWKPINNFVGFYEVSNMGRVRSVDRIIYFKNGKGSRFYRGQILKQKYHNGYALVNLNKNKALSVLPVHRLVAETFLPNPMNYKVVNHKSGVKSDNRAENLEWCTSQYNNAHAIRTGLTKVNIDGLLENNVKNRIKVSCLKEGRIIATADCSRALAKILMQNNLIKDVAIETASRAIRYCANTNHTYHGFCFIKHSDDVVPEKENGKINIIKDGVIMAVKDSINECAFWLINSYGLENVSMRTARRAIRKAIANDKCYHKFHFKKAS